MAEVLTIIIFFFFVSFIRETGWQCGQLGSAVDMVEVDKKKPKKKPQKT